MPSSYKPIALRKENALQALKKRHQLKIILDRMKSGRLLTDICSDADIDWSEHTIRSMASSDGHFGIIYRRAREQQLHQWSDQIILDLVNAPADRDEIL